MKHGRTDENQKEIVTVLRSAGAVVVPLSDIGNGVPDLLCMYRDPDNQGMGRLRLIEVKARNLRYKFIEEVLTEQEKLFKKKAASVGVNVNYIQTPIEALNMIGITCYGKQEKGPYFDENGKVIPLPQWIEKRQNRAYRTPRRTDVPFGVVTTEWLGVQEDAELPPLVYEVRWEPIADMEWIDNKTARDWTKRFATKTEALAYHKVVVEVAKGTKLREKKSKFRYISSSAGYGKTKEMITPAPKRTRTKTSMSNGTSTQLEIEPTK